MDEDSKKVKFYHQKSNLFRVIHADGAWGGLTPDGQIFFSLFNTRPPIPQILGFAVKQDAPWEELPEMKVTKDGILREMEIGIIMSPDNVQALIDFLKGRLETVKKLQDIQTQGKA